ncbi:hypothetical protein LSH36_61g01006 [Paralvinella palmiformis]|uniref:Uncharacterized protein n=1 Tax=Paralvinella palmiformis TaxID=53620 RepID=A0AAD9K444_9ANNE|nr:hypothetical protein LSH36_61g01006 [Paralvinella palmiformis]
MKHSFYFSAWKDKKEGIASLQILDKQRFQLAKEFMKGLNMTSQQWKNHQNTSKPQKPVVVISIITQSRRRAFRNGYKSYYLTQTAMKFLELIQKMDSGFPLKIFICNVDIDPHRYSEALDLGRAMDVANRFSELTLLSSNAKEKEKQDYMFCLNKSLDYDGDFIFLVEDDALPLDDALHVLKHIVEVHVGSKFVSDRATPRVQRTAFIKFYHPDRLLQFTSAGIERIPELVSLAALLSTVVTAFQSLFLATLHMSVQKMHHLWSYWFIFFVLVSLCVGRTHLLRLRQFLSPHLYSLTPTPSCCTQAVLYPRHSARSLLHYMETKTCNNTYAKDHILDEFPGREHMMAYLVQPNVFEHIGLYSALRGEIVDPLIL